MKDEKFFWFFIDEEKFSISILIWEGREVVSICLF